VNSHGHRRSNELEASWPPSIHSVSIPWRLPGQRAAARVHRSWDQSQRCCGSWGPHRHWRCLLVWPRCRGARPPHRLSPRDRAPRWTSPLAARVALAGGADESRRERGPWQPPPRGWIWRQGRGWVLSYPHLFRQAASSWCGRCLLPPELFGAAAGSSVGDPLLTAPPPAPLLLPTDPLTSGSHLSGRTKSWAETVLALILGRE
jgi:hypothetical protein